MHRITFAFYIIQWQLSELNNSTQMIYFPVCSSSSKPLNYYKYICYLKLVSKYYLQLVVNNEADFFFSPYRITRSILQIKSWGTERRLSGHKTSSKYHLPVEALDHTGWEWSDPLQLSAHAHLLKDSHPWVLCMHVRIHPYLCWYSSFIYISFYVCKIVNNSSFTFIYLFILNPF